MYRVLDILTPEEVAECRQIAAGATVRRRQDHQSAQQGQAERAAARAGGLSAERQARSRRDAARSEEFREFAFPGADRAAADDPLQAGHALWRACRRRLILTLAHGTIRSDLSCTIFLNEPEDYEGGALHIRLGDAEHSLQAQAGRGDRLSVRHAARGRAGDQRRAAGRDHLHPEPGPGPVPAATCCSS